MDIASLQAFIAVARSGSFSKASERLFITQPAVSKRVASLELELGVPLFNRIARSISLTEAGKQLLTKAQDLVDQAEELQKYAKNLNQDISGDLAISLAHHIGLYRMPPILRDFNRRFPSVNLDLRFEDSDQAVHAVEQGDIEFAVITLPAVVPEHLLSESVWLDELNFVVAHDHPLTKVPHVGLEHLSPEPSVMTGKETETHQIVWRLFNERGLDLRNQMQTNSLETLKMLVGAGLGWSALPTTMIADQSLHVLDIGQSFYRHLGLVYHSKRSLSNAARALKKAIQLTGE